MKLETGAFMDCRMKGKFRIKGIKSTNPIAVGDWVVCDISSPEQAVITAIEARRNYIIRRAVNLSKQTHILAANIDCLFLFVTLDNPPTFPAFIDRFLASAQAYEIDTVLLFNKEDTYDEKSKEAVHELMKVYQDIGYECLEISALNGTGLTRVVDIMKDKVSIFSGHSGVGKSTLINNLAPELNIKTTALSEQHQQGQHTTTFAQMYDLDFGARIIDTPGIKGFGMVEMEPQEIGDYFREIFKLSKACKYHNCLHIEEPKCAVKEAVNLGKIASSRYKSYCQMVLPEDGQYRTDNWAT